MRAEGEKTSSVLLFVQKCNTGRTKLENWLTLGHSPGEVACPNVMQFIDSHAQRGILPVNRGGGCIQKIATLRGGGRCAFGQGKRWMTGTWSLFFLFYL